jgi:uncharacterized Zn finger protein
MTPWGRGSWYTPAPKKPPPAHGIKMHKAGATWWGQRWIDALQNVLRGDSARLARGRTYARAGRTHDLVVKAGKVTAKVTGSRATPYKITIEIAQLTNPMWQKAIDAMAAKAQFSAELLAGQMPKEIDEVFLAAGASLFPRTREELVTSCSCPDWGDPCKHVAATHYVLGEALDRDPFLLFELRGRTKATVLDALRAARGSNGSAVSKASSVRAATKSVDAALTAPEVPKVVLGKIKAVDYDKAREALPALNFSFDAPVTHGAVLRQLGVPAAWSGQSSPADTLTPLVRAAAETARRIAMAEPDWHPEPVESASSSGLREKTRTKGRTKATSARVSARKGVVKPRGR